MFEPEVPQKTGTSWGVAALLQAASDALAGRFGAVTVKGELAGYTRAASGHCYFTLKDADGAPALLRCAMFRRAAALLDFAPADGQQVELRGRIGIYESRGELQLVAESLRRLGAGSLYEEFLRRRARLEQLGLFDPARKRALPRHPRALGVVTSLGAAALRDVLTTLQRRAPYLPIVVYPAPVQGAEAPLALTAALKCAADRREVDVLLLVRGGGSMEDLWAYNDERLVRAVAACALPVVCGVGHETDVTLCDLAADLRAPTPTAAAELAAPTQEDLLAGLQQAAERLRSAVDRKLQNGEQQLDKLSLRMGRPARLLQSQVEGLQSLQGRMQRAVGQLLVQRLEALPRLSSRLGRAAQGHLRQQQLRLAGSAQGLQANDPQRVLKRGYAWIESEDGQPVVSASRLHAGQAVSAVWSDGRAQALIQRVEALPPEV